MKQFILIIALVLGTGLMAFSPRDTEKKETFELSFKLPIQDEFIADVNSLSIREKLSVMNSITNKAMFQSMISPMGEILYGFRAGTPALNVNVSANALNPEGCGPQVYLFERGLWTICGQFYCEMGYGINQWGQLNYGSGTCFKTAA